MKRKMRRLMAYLLVALMCLTSLPVDALAQQVDASEGFSLRAAGGVTRLVLNPRSAVIAVNAQQQFVANLESGGTTTTPDAARCEWTSETPDVATVDENGLVTGVSAGTATITCTYTANGDEVVGVAMVRVTNLEYRLTYESNYPADAMRYVYQNGASGTVAAAINTTVADTFQPGTGATVRGDLFSTINYDFTGYLGSDGKTYNVGDEIPMNANLTLTAQWEANDNSTQTQTIYVRYYYDGLTRPDNVGQYIEKQVEGIVTGSYDNYRATFVTGNNQDTLNTQDSRLRGWRIDGVRYAFNQEVTVSATRVNEGSYIYPIYKYIVNVNPDKQTPENKTAYAQFFIRRRGVEGYGEADRYYSVGSGLISTEGIAPSSPTDIGIVAGSDDIYDDVTEYIIEAPSPEQIARLTNEAMTGDETIRWYVIKWQSDGYHVDGVIVSGDTYWNVEFLDDDGSVVYTALVPDATRLGESDVPQNILDGSLLAHVLRDFTGWQTENGQKVTGFNALQSALGVITKDVQVTATFTNYDGYEVRYLEEGTGEVLHEAKMARAVIGQSINSRNEVIPIEGYRFVYASPETLIVSQNAENVITLYYEKNETTYTVQHWGEYLQETSGGGRSLADRKFEGEDDTLTVDTGTEITEALLREEGLIRTDLTGRDLHIDGEDDYTYEYDSALEAGEPIYGIEEDGTTIRIYYDRVLQKSTFNDGHGVTARDSIPDERHEIRQGKITVVTHYVGGSLDGQDVRGNVYFVWHEKNMVDLAVTLNNSEYIINAIVAEQDGPSNNRFNQDASALVDNVVGNTTVDIYLTPKYTVEYYKVGTDTPWKTDEQTYTIAVERVTANEGFAHNLPTSFTASALPTDAPAGHHYEGWHIHTQGGELVEAGAQVAIADEWEAADAAGRVIKLYCDTQEDAEVTIYYEPVTQVNGKITAVYTGGKVSPDSESLAPATGTAQGSTATANDGYEFQGWFANETCEGEPLSRDAAYTPQQANGVYAAATYYALFVYTGGTDAEKQDITVQKVWVAPEPATGVAKIELRRTAEGLSEEVVDSFTAIIGGTNSHTFKTLPKYAPNSQEYTYTVYETSVPKGYTSSVGTDGQEVALGGTATVTNTHESQQPEQPEKTATVTEEDSITVDGETWVKPGGIITYTITYYNHTNQTATVTVTDMLDEDLKVVDEGTTEGYTLVGGEKITWEIENVAPFTGGTITLVAQVREGAVAEVIENTAYAKVGNEAEQKSETVKVNVFQPAIKVTKEASAPEKGNTYALGEEITYTVTVTNTGNVDLTGVTLKDTLVEDIPDYTAAFALDVDASRTYTYTHTVTEADIAGGEIVNTATATGTAQDETVKDSDTVTCNTVEQASSLTVTKEAANEPADGYALGDTITYTVTVENTGNQTLTNITVTDEREGAQFENGTNDTKTTTIASLAPGAKAELKVTYTLTEADIAAANGSFANTVTAKSGDTEGDATETVTVETPETGLEVKKTVAGINGAPQADGYYAGTGDVVAYQVAVTNTGNQTMENVAVGDTLLGEEGFANTTTAEGVTYAEGEGWTIASIAPNETVTITYTYTVQESDLGQNGQLGTIENAATAAGEDSEEGGDDEPVPTRIQLTLTGDSDEVAYTGAEQSVTTYTPSVEGLTITGVSYAARGTNPGEYSGAFSGQGSIGIEKDGQDVTAQYEVTYAPGKLTITNPEARFVIATDSEQKVYDGQPLTDYGYTLDGVEAETDTATSSCFTLLGNDVLEVTFTDNATTADVIESTITDVGEVENYITYRVLRDGVDVTAQYANSIQVQYGTLEVTPRQVTIVSNTNSKDYDGTALTDEGFTVYEGEIASLADVANADQFTQIAQEAFSANIVGTVTDVQRDGNDAVVGVANAFDEEQPWTLPEGVNRGNYEVHLLEGTLTVNPRKVTVIAASDEKEFDGTALTNLNYAVVGGHVESADAFTGAQAIVGNEIISAEIDGSQTIPGQSDNTVGDVTVKGNPANYDIKKVNGTLTVTERREDFAIVLTGQTVTEVYDSQPHTAEMASGTLSDATGTLGNATGTVDNEQNTVTFTLTNGATFTLEFEDFAVSRTDAGTDPVGSEAVASKAVVKLNGEDVTGQFNITFTPGTLTINPRPVTVIAASDSKVYDGTPLTNTDYAVVDDHVESADASAFKGEKAIVGEETISATITGSQTIPGSSANPVGNVTVEGNAGNYDIKEVNGTLTVTDRSEKYEITVVGNSGEVDYNGTEQSVTGFETLNFTVNGQTYTVEGLTAEAKGTDASDTPYEGTITGEAIIKDVNDNVVTDQFTVTRTPGTLTIKPYPLTIATDSDEKGYDGQPLTAYSGTVNEKSFAAPDGSVLFKIDGTDEMVLITVTGAQTLIGSSENAFTVGWAAEGGATAKESNYTPTLTPGTLTVTGDEIDVEKQDGQQEQMDYEYKLGDTITYTITVVNRGEEEMTNIVVTEETGNEIVSVSGEGVGEFEIAENGLSVTIASLEPGATATITAEHTVTQEDLYEKTIGNTVKVTADYEDKKIEVEAEDKITTEGARPAIAVEKTIAQVVRGDKTLTGDALEGYIADLGDVITYSVTVKNTGNVDLANVELTDAMWKDEAEVVGNIAQGGKSAPYDYTHTVTEADVAEGKIENTAEATGTAKGETVTDSDTVTTNTATAQANLVVTKEVTRTATAADGKYALGETIVYKLTVQNTGNQSITEDITVEDSLEGIVDTTEDGRVTYADGVWTIEGGLAGRESVEITYTYTVQETDVEAGKITNAATASGGGHEDTDDKTVETEDPNPSLSVTKSATGEPEEGGKYALGETVTYEVVVTNNGNVTLTNIVVTDERTGAVFAKIDGAEIANGTNAYTIESMVPNASHTFEVTYVVTERDILDAADANGMLANSVTVEGENPDGEDPEPPQPGEAEVPVEEPNPSLTVTKTAMGEAPEDGYKPGDTVTYQVVVKNDGNLTLTNVVVTDERENAAFTTVEDANFEFDGNTVTIGEMLPNATYTFKVTYEVTEGDILAEGDTLVNMVNVTGDGPDEWDPDTVDDEEDVPVEPPEASLAVDKTSDAEEGEEYRAGDTINYTITVTNTGNVTVTGITLQDTLVDEKEIDVEGYDEAFNLAPGEVKEFTYTYTVTGDDLGATGGTVKTFLENTVTVEGEAPESEDPDEEIPDPEDEDEVDVPVGNKIAVTITAQDNSWTYDGIEHTHNVFDITVDGTTYENQTDEYTYEYTYEGDTFEGDTFTVTVTGSVTDVADTVEGNNVAALVSIKDADGVDRSGNYEVTIEDGSLAITPRELTIVASDNLDNVYSGEPYGSDGYDTKQNLAEGHTVESVTLEGEETDAGFYHKAIVASKAVIVDANGEDVTANYNIDYVSGDIEIKPYELTVTAASDEKPFDGTPLENDGYTIEGMNGATGTTFADSEIAATVEGSQTLVGESANEVTAVSIDGKTTQLDTLTPVDEDKYDFGNFLVTVENGTLKVTARDEDDKFEIKLKANSGEEEYNGQAHTESGLASATMEGVAGKVDNEARTVSFTHEGVSFTVEFPEVSGTGTDVAEYPVGDDSVASGVVVKLGGTVVTEQFDITFTPGTLTITPKAVTITAVDKTYYYNGEAQGPNGAAFAGDVSQNATADGLAGGDSLTGIAVDGAQRNVRYENGQVAPYEDELEPRDAAITRGGVDVTDNYEITYANADLTILPRGSEGDESDPLTITALDKTYYYNGEAQGPNGAAFAGTDTADLTVTGLVGGDSLEEVFIDGAQRNVRYENGQVAPYEGELAPRDAAVANGATDVTGNYKIVYVAGDLTILPRGSEGDPEGEVTITPVDRQKVYDAQAYALEQAT